MNRLIVILIFTIFISGCHKEYVPQPPQPIRHLINGCYVKLGCCSHHGGVCGDHNGKALCCDGSVSKSCKCE